VGEAGSTIDHEQWREGSFADHLLPGLAARDLDRPLMGG